MDLFLTILGLSLRSTGTDLGGMGACFKSVGLGIRYGYWGIYFCTTRRKVNVKTYMYIHTHVYTYIHTCTVTYVRIHVLHVVFRTYFSLKLKVKNGLRQLS